MSTLSSPKIHVVRGQSASLAHATMTQMTPDTLRCDYEYDTPQEVTHFDTDLADAGIPFRRWLVGDVHNPVAIAFCFRATWNTPRHTFWAHIRVNHDWRNAGIGHELLRTVHDWAASAGAQRVRVMSHLTPDCMQFLAAHGYTHIGTEQIFSLTMPEVPNFVPTPTNDTVEIIPLASLMRRETDAVERACVLHAAVSLDVPMPDEPIVTLSKFRRLLGESVDPADYLIAIKQEMLVGESILMQDDDDASIYWQHATGVLPAFRGQQIATKLKKTAIAHAARRGAKFVRTWMELSNLPIIQLNTTLGFRAVDEPGSKILIFECTL